jgi:chaperonin GroES
MSLPVERRGRNSTFSVRARKPLERLPRYVGSNPAGSTMNDDKNLFARKREFDMSIDYTKVRPLLDHVLVKRTVADEKSKGGIIIPDNAKEKPAEGVVLAVGPGRIHGETGKRVEPGVKTGDKVLFGKYSGVAMAGLNAKDIEIMIIREEEILAIVEP